MIKLGIVADSHVPDRAPGLPAGTLETLAQAGVAAILHAGDVTRPHVLRQLAQVAPVTAVRGNADLWLRLPLAAELCYEGVRLVLAHGHCGWLAYAREKLLAHTVGFYLGRYHRQVRARYAGPGVAAVVFGHSHYSFNQVVDGVLLFNPGSLAPDYHGPYWAPTLGLLTIQAGKVRGEVIPLAESQPFL
jgi:putative phosphoesterase